MDPRREALDLDYQPVAPSYEELGKPQQSTSHRNDIIFITARFRTGSTLLWNLFRNLDGFTSYYEPLNERRWFDPAARGSRMDATHRNIDGDYWREYDGLEELDRYYREDWIRHNLLMGANDWDADLKRYVEVLVERAPGRPVLQFNRIDFRVPWFRHQFPNANLIHLYRHPRDQWCSSLVDPKAFPRHGKNADFLAYDRYYLLGWAKDLKRHFPFLVAEPEAHPYELFYYIWKLSYLFGRKYAHYSLAFEDLLADPTGRLREMFDALAIDRYDVDKLTSLFTKPAVGRWKEYADDNWFRAREEACETVMADFLDRNAR